MHGTARRDGAARDLPRKEENLMVDVVSRATADSPFASANGWGRRVFDCRCGRPVFFRNSACLACGAELGFDPERRELLPLEAVEGTGELRASGEDRSAVRYRRCAKPFAAVSIPRPSRFPAASSPPVSLSRSGRPS